MIQRPGGVSQRESEGARGASKRERKREREKESEREKERVRETERARERKREQERERESGRTLLSVHAEQGAEGLREWYYCGRILRRRWQLPPQV